ncbi:MAG: hypothetical protein FWH04_06665 [Oscillospiraceae bacterium]|nr:hypothetical protein [Oscillospiraceae bacterium]
MKLLWRRWWIIAGVSVPVGIISVFLVFFLVQFVETSSGTLGSGLEQVMFIIIAPPIVYYILIFALSIWICKANIVQAIIVAATSPLSVVAHGYWLWLLLFG